MSDTQTDVPLFRSYKPTQLFDETTTAPIESAKPTQAAFQEMFYKTQGSAAIAPLISIDRLYEAPADSPSQIVRALELLKQASDNLTAARNSDSPMQADSYVQRVQHALPKLFAYRSIGDGFGVVINSLYFGFLNLRGTPLTPAQLNVVWRIVRELRARPAIPVEQGIQRAEELELSGLEIDPSDLGEILEGLESATDE